MDKGKIPPKFNCLIQDAKEWWRRRNMKEKQMALDSFQKRLLFSDKMLSKCEFIWYTIAGISLILMFFIVCYGVIGRELLNISVLWANEAAAFLMVYITFFSASWILKNKGHVTADVLINYLSERKAKILDTFISLILIIVATVFFWSSLKLTWISFQNGNVMMGTVAWPNYLLYLPIPFGTLLLLFRFILNTIHNFYDLKR